MTSAPSQTSQTTTVEMSPEQQWLFNLAKPGVNWWAKKPPEQFPGSQIAGFTQPQLQGQQMAVNAAGNQRDLAQDAGNTAEFMMGDIWNPSSNPYLRQAIGAATRPVTEQFQRTVMPGIQDEFVGAGQEFGGSRRGVAEGVASGQYLDTIGDTASKIVQDQYANNLNASIKALALVPQTQQAMTTPATTMSAVGDVQQRMDQARLNENVQNWNWDTNAPYLQAKEILSLIGGLPGGSSTAVGTGAQVPWWQQALGIGSTGLGIMSALGGGGGAAAGLGSLLAFI